MVTGRLGPHDVVVDVQNGIPFLAPLYCGRPVVVLVHHVHRAQWPNLLSITGERHPKEGVAKSAGEAGKMASSFDQAECWRDDFPAVGTADLTGYLPFLSLSS